MASTPLASPSIFQGALAAEVVAARVDLLGVSSGFTRNAYTYMTRSFLPISGVSRHSKILRSYTPHSFPFLPSILSGGPGVQPPEIFVISTLPYVRFSAYWHC